MTGDLAALGWAAFQAVVARHGLTPYRAARAEAAAIGNYNATGPAGYNVLTTRPAMCPIYRARRYGANSLARHDIPGLRALEAKMLAASAELPPPEGVSQHDFHAPPPKGSDVPVLLRVFRPTGGFVPAPEGPLPAVLYLHGGGGVAGTVEGTNRGCALMAKECGCLVASVGYRLAPEHAYPAAIEDCYAALAWLAAGPGAGEIGVDVQRVGVMGNSSGGGLAAALCLLARDRGGPRLVFQVLVQPMLDDRNVAPATEEAPDTFVWSRENNRLAWGYQQLAGVESEVPCYAAAARAQTLAGLPPAYVAVGELDLFLNESMDYARRLIADGVATELHVYPGAPHGFHVYVPRAPISKRFNAGISTAVRWFLHGHR